MGKIQKTLELSMERRFEYNGVMFHFILTSLPPQRYRLLMGNGNIERFSYAVAESFTRPEVFRIVNIMDTSNLSIEDIVSYIKL